MKLAIGVLLALAVGAGARLLDIPAPAPPRLAGALLVVAITCGYIAADRVLAARQEAAATESRDGP